MMTRDQKRYATMDESKKETIRSAARARYERRGKTVIGHRVQIKTALTSLPQSDPLRRLYALAHVLDDEVTAAARVLVQHDRMAIVRYLAGQLSAEMKALSVGVPW